jgi:hypothetical protein
VLAFFGSRIGTTGISAVMVLMVSPRIGFQYPAIGRRSCAALLRTKPR